jgi:S1-C subfamily serine protease
MDQFGVTSARLKAIARAPKIPPLGEMATSNRTSPQANWLGATIRDLTMGEYSAMGMSMESGGICLVDAPASSVAFKAGLRTGDFVMKVNGRAVPNLATFLLTVPGTEGGPSPKLEVIRNQQRITLGAGF